MTSLDDIYTAINGVRSRDLAGRLAVRGTGAAVKAVKSFNEDAPGFYDITNDVKQDGFGGYMIVPNKFENEPELFVGPFAQLGTYLGIENPVARFVVDAVFDPLNLIVPGTGRLLNTVGRLAHVATGAIHAAEVAGKTVKTVDDVLDGLEAGIHLATQSPKYLDELRTAATSGVGRKQWKAMIDEGLAAETTEAGKELLGILRGNRKAMKDIYALAKSHGDDLVGESLKLQPTLRGRLVAGQVNPLIRIERPFARARASLTAQGFIGENSVFAVKQGDYFMWTPVSDAFVLGGGKFAEAAAAKSGFQRGLNSFAEKVTPKSVAIESVQDAGMFRTEVDTERLLGNAKMAKDQLSVLLGSPRPVTQDDLLRQMQAATPEQLTELAQAYGLDPAKTDFADLHEWALSKLAASSELEDARVLGLANERQRQLLEAIEKGEGLPLSPNEAINETLNEAIQPGLRSIMRVKNLRDMAQDPMGLGNALHANTGTLAVVGNGFLSQVGEVITAATRKTTPRIAGGRKLERAYRESLRYFRELPELWTKEGDDVYKLSTSALEKMRAKHAGPAAEATALAKELGGRKFYHVTDAGDEIRRAGKLDAEFGDGEVYLSKSKEVASNRAAINNSGSDGKWEVIEVDVESLVGLDAQRAGLTGHGREIVVFGDVPLTPKKQVSSDAPELALFERFLERAKENGIDMEAVLSRQGFRDGMSEIVDMLVDVDDAMLTEANRLGLHEEFVKNHYRRTVRPAKRAGRRALGSDALSANVGGKQAEDIDELIQRAIDDARDIDPSLGKGKGPESVQKLRKATEKQLVAMEKLGLIEFEWDSLSAMADQFAGHQRAVLARQLTDELAFNLPVIDREALEVMNKHSDFKAVPGFLKGVQPHLDSGLVSGKIPNVAKAKMGKTAAGSSVVRQPWEFMEEFGFKKNSEKVFKDFYEAVEVKGGVDVGDDFAAVKRAVLRGSAEDSRFIASRAREGLMKDVRASPALAKKIGIVRRDGSALSPDELSKAFDGGSLPKGVREPKAVKKRLAKALEDRNAQVREGLLKDATPGKRAPEKVWVLKPMAGHLKDALNLWDKHGFGTEKGVQGFARFWRDWNHRLKAVKLNLSPFHLNVISFAGLLIDPVASARLLKDPLLKGYRQNLLKHQAIGSIGGAVVGGALGDDEESAVFGGIAGLIYGTAIGAAFKQAKIARNFLFDPEMSQYAARAGSVGWHGNPDDRSIGVVARMATRFSDNLKAKHGQTLASRMIDGFVGVQLDFEKAMWEISHNGHKMHAFAALAQQNDSLLAKEGLKEGSARWVAKQRELDTASMQVVNSALGGFQASKLWNDPGWQRRAQDFLMAPDWTVGNVLGAGNIFLNQSIWKNAATGAAVGTAAELAANGFDVGEITGFGAVGGGLTAMTLGGLAQRSMARIMVREAGGNQARAQSLKLYRNAILGGYFFGNLVNHMNTGRWMWENPEGKKLSIAQPGGEYYVTLGKPYTETLEFASAIDRDKVPFPGLSRISTKISPLGQLVVQAATQETGLGRPLITAEQNPVEAAGSVGAWLFDTVTPISLGRPGAAALGALTGTEREPGARLAASAISAAGFAVSRDRGVASQANLAGALGAQLGAGIDLSALQRQDLASQLGQISATENLAVEQRNLR